MRVICPNLRRVIQEKRRKKGMSTEQLGNVVGIGKTQSYAVCGGYTVPNVARLIDILIVLETTAGEFDQILQFPECNGYDAQFARALFGIKRSMYLSVDELINHASDDIVQSLFSMNHGSPGLAVPTAKWWIARAEDRIEVEVGGNRSRLQDLLLWAYPHILRFIITVDDRKTIAENSWVYFVKLIRLGKALRDKTAVDTAYSFQSAAYYIGRDYQNALRYSNRIDPRSVSNLTLPPTTLTVALRISALIHAYSTNKSEFLRYETLARQALDANIIATASDRSLLWEGLGQGRGVLRLPEVYDRLDEATHEARDIPLREVQVTRTIGVAEQHSEKPDKDRVKEEIRDTLRLCTLDGKSANYIRHMDEMVDTAKALGIFSDLEADFKNCGWLPKHQRY